MVEMPSGAARWRRVRTIAADAMELPATARAAFLEASCGGDEELCAQVEALLEADRRDGGPLDRPAAEAAADLIAAIGRDPEAPDALIGRRFGPYRIRRRIGAGGMGEVYEAVDERLDRRVAVKLLPAGWSRNAAAKARFLREARAISALDHPNICTLHDLGEGACDPGEEPRLFLVLAFYPGETLERHLARGPLAVEEALQVAIQVGRGLERAHREGIVHRDVKPANVMIVDEPQSSAADRYKLLDFGIARIAGSDALTRTGTSPGTPAYMAPEQLRGETVDHRADIWSLGVLLYEMIAGRRPFAGESPQATTHAILEHDPEPLGRLCPDVPPALEKAVARALARDPAARYKQIGDFLADLEAGTAPPPLAPAARSWAAVAVTGLALALAAGWWVTRDPGIEPSPEKRPGAVARGVPESVEAAPVVAVVPFDNRTGDVRLDTTGAILARLLSDDLARSRHLQVVSARRVAALGEGPGLAERAAAAGIDVLLGGEILPGEDGFAVVTRLEEIASGRLRGARRVDGLQPAALLRAADDLAREARKALGVPPAENVDVFAADFAAGNPEAYGLYVEGLEAWTDYRHAAAERAFAAALERAPDFTMARYRLAWTLAVTGRQREALAEMRRAVAEVDRLPDREARYLRAGEATLEQRYDEAIAAYRALLERYAYETEARMSLAHLLAATGRHREALGIAEELARLEPENGVAWSLTGSAHLALGELHEATSDFERYVALEPGNANAHHLLGDAYRAQGELELAAGEYGRALDLDPAFHFATVALAVVEALQGRGERAEERLSRLIDDPSVAVRHRLDAGFELASLYRAGGRFRQAAGLLEELSGSIAEEGVRESLALSVRASSLLTLGETEEARRLFEDAIERSPGVATRYLFGRGRLELEEERWTAVEATAAQILRVALPPEDPDRTEEKAAAYLRGAARLAVGEVEEAIVELSRAVALDGHEYAIYRLELARAYLAAGRLREALAAARQSRTDLELNPPRLDLELDRTLALLVLARVQEAMGRSEAAADQARAFLELWSAADPSLPQVIEARRLAPGGRNPG